MRPATPAWPCTNTRCPYELAICRCSDITTTCTFTARPEHSSRLSVLPSLLNVTSPQAELSRVESPPADAPPVRVTADRCFTSRGCFKRKERPRRPDTSKWRARSFSTPPRRPLDQRCDSARPPPSLLCHDQLDPRHSFQAHAVSRPTASTPTCLRTR